MFIWEIGKLGAPSQKGGRQTKASILSFILDASEAGATDATWQCSGHRLATSNKTQTNSRSTAAFPRQLLGNKHQATSSSSAGKGQILPRPSDVQQSWPRGRGGICPGKTPALVTQPGESPSPLQRVRPGSRRARPLASFRLNW